MWHPTRSEPELPPPVLLMVHFFFAILILLKLACSIDYSRVVLSALSERENGVIFCDTSGLQLPWLTENEAEIAKTTTAVGDPMNDGGAKIFGRPVTRPTSLSNA